MIKLDRDTYVTIVIVLVVIVGAVLLTYGTGWLWPADVPP